TNGARTLFDGGTKAVMGRCCAAAASDGRPRKASLPRQREVREAAAMVDEDGRSVRAVWVARRARLCVSFAACLLDRLRSPGGRAALGGLAAGLMERVWRGALADLLEGVGTESRREIRQNTRPATRHLDSGSTAGSQCSHAASTKHVLRIRMLEESLTRCTTALPIRRLAALHCKRLQDHCIGPAVDPPPATGDDSAARMDIRGHKHCTKKVDGKLRRPLDLWLWTKIRIRPGIAHPAHAQARLFRSR
ncbi:hypothetical protein THAOC_10412, partial [Thalassiosira oceanica]